jgi:predicted RNase H-like HicB family nuclease
MEKTIGNYSAYVSDLPGCIATGASLAEVERTIQEAIEFHLAGINPDGIQPPVPTSQVSYVDVAAFWQFR